MEASNLGKSLENSAREKRLLLLTRCLGRQTVRRVSSVPSGSQKSHEMLVFFPSKARMS